MEKRTSPSRNEVLVDGDLHRMVVRTEEIIKRINDDDPFLLVLGGGLVRVGQGVNPRFEPMTIDRMTRYLAETITFFDKKKGKREIVHPPASVVRVVLAASSYPVPVVERLVTVPVFAPDGSLLTDPGYSSSGKLYLSPSVAVPPIPSSPTPDDLGRAKVTIEEVLADFPFVSPADKTHAIAALLLPVTRSMISGPTPMMLINAPAKGTGKSLLAEVIRTPSTPSGGVMTGGRDRDEWRKRITSSLRGGPTVITIDNLHGHLNSEALAAVLTSTIWEDRILGVSEIATLPNQALWLATGNGVTLSDELRRRTVPILLDAGVEEPHLRSATAWRHPDLKTWVQNHRADLVWSELVIVQTWIAAGRPSGSKSLGSFESWASTTGGILETAGYEGFLGNLDEWEQSGADPDTVGWRAFVTSWNREFGTTEVRASDLLVAYEYVDDDFLNLGDGSDRSRGTRLGKALSGKRDAVVGNFKLTLAGESSGSNRWRLTPTAKG